MCYSSIFGWYLLEVGDLEPNGKLIYTKLEGLNEGLGYRTFFILETDGISPIDEEARELGFSLEK